MARIAARPCITKGAPFNLEHLGHLRNSKYNLAARNSCIVSAPRVGKMLLRFTPSLCPEEYEEHPAFAVTAQDHRFPDIAKMAQMHQRHLGKLAELGIQTTFRALAIGKCQSMDAVPGIYTFQTLLPAGTRPAKLSRAEFSVLGGKLLAYSEWAKNAENGNCLSDITSPRQYSRLSSGALVLHDLEPLYGFSGDIEYEIDRWQLDYGLNYSTAIDEVA